MNEQEEKQISFAEALKTERVRIGWSQKVLCERTGANYETYRQWETGKSAPSIYYQGLILRDLRGRR